MLILKNPTRGNYGDETAIRAYNIAISETLGSLKTLQFAFIADDTNRVGTDMMIPRTKVTEPVTGQIFRISSSNPVPSNKYRTYTVTANHIGTDLHDRYIEAVWSGTHTLKACMDLVVKETDFNYQIEGTFSNYYFSETFGTGYADDILNQLAGDFKFEYYFDNYTIHIAKSVGKYDAFLFVDGANVSKISVAEDYSTITTYIKGYAGTPDEATGVYPISTEYYSPLASSDKWGKIDNEPYSNENLTKSSLLSALKEKVHDYPDVQYSVDYVNFKKNVSGFKNDTTVGNYGWIRDRFGIDISVRVQARTFYPQDTKNNGSITFGNIIYDPVVLQAQMKKAWEDNAKLGAALSKDVKAATKKAQDAYNSRLLGSLVGQVPYTPKIKSYTTSNSSVTLNIEAGKSTDKITEYVISCFDVANSLQMPEESMAVSNNNNVSYTWTGLTTGNKYVFGVAARNGVGISGTSTPQSVTVGSSAAVKSMSLLKAISTNTDDDIAPIYNLYVPTINAGFSGLAAGDKFYPQTTVEAIKGLEKYVADHATSYGLATHSNNGLMSSQDKITLDSLTNPVSSIKMVDSITGLIYALTIANGQIKIEEVNDG